MSKYNEFKQSNFLSRLSTLNGKILELGFGDADTLFHYHPDADVVAIEKNRKWVDLAGKKLNARGIKHIRVMSGSAEDLPFPDEEFDFITSAFMLCSVNSQADAVREMYRVLKTGGSYIALEHTLSRNTLFRGLQKMLAKPVSKIADNCHLNSDPLSVIGMQPFQVLKAEYFPYYLEPPLYIEAKKNAGDNAASVRYQESK